jgi:AraC-like DNA-binding protein
LFLSYNEKLWFVSGGYGQITDNYLLIYLKWINRIGVFGFINLQLLVYVIFSFYFYNQYKKQIENIFSYKENIDLKWIKMLVISFLVLFLMIDMIHFFSVKTSMPHRILFNTSMLIFNFVIFANGLYQKNIFIKPFVSVENPIIPFQEVLESRQLNDESNQIPVVMVEVDSEIDNSQSKYHNSNLSDNVKIKIIEDLEKYMTMKPYNYSNLTIDDVAESLQTNTKYLSQIINETYQKNFYNYINMFRVNDSKEMLISPEFSNYSTEGIAKSVGFNSKSSFYTAFKKYTGLTPIEFKNKSMIENA